MTCEVRLSVKGHAAQQVSTFVQAFIRECGLTVQPRATAVQ